MYEEALCRAKRFGAEHLELMVWAFNESARKFYEKCGMTLRSFVMDMKLEAGTPIYPDANSTLRLTYGRGLPYKPADGVEYEMCIRDRHIIINTLGPKTFSLVSMMNCFT